MTDNRGFKGRQLSSYFWWFLNFVYFLHIDTAKKTK